MRPEPLLYRLGFMDTEIIQDHHDFHRRLSMMGYDLLQQVPKADVVLVGPHQPAQRAGHIVDRAEHILFGILTGRVTCVCGPWRIQRPLIVGNKATSISSA